MLAANLDQHGTGVFVFVGGGLVKRRTIHPLAAGFAGPSVDRRRGGEKGIRHLHRFGAVHIDKDQPVDGAQAEVVARREILGGEVSRYPA